MAKVKSSPLTVLRLTFDLFKPENRQIFCPLIIVLFANYLALEVFYFSPRFPLSVIFDPIISRVWGEQFLHYPLNFLVLPKMFYYAQLLIFVFFSSLLMALIADMVSSINNEKPVVFTTSLQKSWSGYIYIVFYAALSLGLFELFDHLYGKVVFQALKIQATTGFHFWVKKAVLYGAPYVQFLYGILVTALLIYIPVVIILEKKKFFAAIFLNFKTLFGSFWLTFMLVLVPSLFYLPLLLVRDNMEALADAMTPDIQIVVMAISAALTAAINIFIIAAATTYYLYKKENP